MTKKGWSKHIQWRDHFTQEVKWSHLIQLSKDRCIGLIYKVISYIIPNTKKHWKEEISISKDAKSKLEVSANVAELSLDVK